MQSDGDVQRIYAAGFIRAASVSFVGVTLAIYLAERHYSATAIGFADRSGAGGLVSGDPHCEPVG